MVRACLCSNASGVVDMRSCTLLPSPNGHLTLLTSPTGHLTLLTSPNGHVTLLTSPNGHLILLTSPSGHLTLLTLPCGHLISNAKLENLHACPYRTPTMPPCLQHSHPCVPACPPLSHTPA
eukprot:184636-Chlamydomonas_euryale.AAC.1